MDIDIGANDGVSSEAPPILIWNFNDASAFNFPASFVEVSADSARLKIVDQDLSGNDFENGNFQGTAFDSSRLGMVTKNNSNLDVREILPDHASGLVGYWKM
ncbi:MAG: hypothetical protein AAF203_07100, partial [Pseudomonadota bacterium]